MGAIRTALVDAIAAALPVAVVYFAGWAYLSSYLAEFGIDATQVEVPFSTVLVYAFRPLSYIWPQACLLGLVIVLAVAISFRETPSCITGLGFGVCSVIIYCLLFAIRDAANEEAKALAQKVWTNEKSMTEVVVNPPVSVDPAYEDYVYCRDSDRLRQVIGLPNRMFLFCRSEAEPQKRGALFLLNDAGAILYVANRTRNPSDVPQPKK
ncbi:hypothetical protein GOC19_25640 [Sinorhizobium meliloti]|nr:hypothetical protein [Sinorhizobium meliloti]